MTIFACTWVAIYPAAESGASLLLHYHSAGLVQKIGESSRCVFPHNLKQLADVHLLQIGHTFLLP
jgi:hypothetical protein